MKCPKCNGTGVNPKGPIDACPLCTRIAEMNYRHAKKMEQKLKEKDAA